MGGERKGARWHRQTVGGLVTNGGGGGGGGDDEEEDGEAPPQHLKLVYESFNDEDELEVIQEETAEDEDAEKETVKARPSSKGTVATTPTTKPKAKPRLPTVVVESELSTEKVWTNHHHTFIQSLHVVLPATTTLTGRTNPPPLPTGDPDNGRGAGGNRRREAAARAEGGDETSAGRRASRIRGRAGCLQARNGGRSYGEIDTTHTYTTHTLYITPDPRSLLV